MDIEHINEELAIIQDNDNMYEMANIEKQIIVHNDRENGQAGDNLKFAHFNYKNVHFKFTQECPKNITQLKEMIAFNVEQKKLNDKDLTELLKLLKRKPSGKKRGIYNCVYDLVIDTWETLNERDADYID